MKNNQRREDNNSLKIISILLLVGILIGITYYAIIILNKGAVYSHLFYIPIVMACFWWGRKGFIISLFFSLFLLLNHHFFRTDISWINDITRVLMFCIVGIIFAYAGENNNIVKNKLKEYTGTLEKKVEERTKELKKSEEKAREMAHHMRILFETSPDLLVAINTDGKIIDINRIAEDTTGFTRKEMINTNFIDYFTEPDNAYGGYHKTLTEGILRDYPLEVRHVEGHSTSVLFNAAVFHNGQEGVFAIARDITVQKRAEGEKEKISKDLKKKNEELERFLYTTTHDLKTPLVTIRGFCEFLEGDLKERNIKEAEESLKRITGATHQMDNVIESILKIGRLGWKKSSFTKTDFNTLVRKIVNDLEIPRAKNGVEIVVSSKMPILLVEKENVEEVFSNLIINAIEHAKTLPHPRIEIGSKKMKDSYQFYVKDNGVGIAPEYHEKIFEPFEKLKSKKTGTGIGLAIVKKIIEDYSGEVWVDSKLGKGATFWFSLPTSDNNPNKSN